jgi:hypothetical protein
VDKINTTNLVYKIYTDKDKYIIKTRDKPEKINFEISNKLRGIFPIEYPIATNDGMPYVFYGTQYYVLYNFLTGSL